MTLQDLQARLPVGMAPLVEAGEGDYAQAFQSGDQMVLLARSPHASWCLKVVANLSPALSRHVTCAIPGVTHSGELDGQTFVVYPRIPGEPLSDEQFRLLAPEQQATAADAVGQFMAELQAFPVEQARQAGAIEALYPFAFLEESLREGPPEELYAADLSEAAGLLTAEQVADLKERLDVHLRTMPSLPTVLLHGEISVDHVLFDPATGKVTGFIDLNGLHLGRPTRDLLYVIEQYGEDFTRRVLRHLPALPPEETLAELRFLQLWHSLIRLNWMHAHGYQRGVNYWREDVGRLLNTADKSA